LIDLSDDAFSDLKAWVPATGGIVFMKDLALAIGAERNVPDPKKGGNRTFFGRNDVLEVRFANSRLSANANLVRSSNDSDAALIKVDTPQRLNTVGIKRAVSGKYGCRACAFRKRGNCRAAQSP